MLTFLAGDVVAALSQDGVKVGGEYRLIPLGSTPLRAIHFLDIIARVAMMFGGVTPGDAERLLGYAKERARAVVILFPGLSDEEVALIDAFQLLGIPVLTIGGYEGWFIYPCRSGRGRSPGNGTPGYQSLGHRDPHPHGLFSCV